MITSDGQKGLGAFVGNVSLPALLFYAMASLDLTAINWPILLVILVSKGITFLIAFAAQILANRTVEGLGQGGIFAIFATQSNDIAFGLPVVQALYPHSNYSAYLYLAAPIQLILLNPIGFALMEIANNYKQRTKALKDDGSDAPARPRPSAVIVALRIVWKVLTNSVVFMVIVGLLFQLAFGKPPAFIAGLMNTVGNAFTATALFVLGLSLKGRTKALTGKGSLWVTLLVLLKVFVLPMLCRFLGQTFVGQGAENDDILEFLYIYGSFPTPPSVFVFAAQYGFAIDIMSGGVVACNIVFAPIMLANTIFLSSPSIGTLLTTIESLSFYSSLTSITALVLLMAVWNVLGGPRYRTFPFDIVQMFVISKVLFVASHMSWCTHTTYGSTLYLVAYHVTNILRYACRVWATILALGLFQVASRREGAKRFRKYYHMLGWGIPICFEIMVIAMTTNNLAPDAFLGFCWYISYSQTIPDLTNQATCLIAVVVFLMLAERQHRRRRLPPHITSLFGEVARRRSSTNSILEDFRTDLAINSAANTRDTIMGTPVKNSNSNSISLSNNNTDTSNDLAVPLLDSRMMANAAAAHVTGGRAHALSNATGPGGGTETNINMDSDGCEFRGGLSDKARIQMFLIFIMAQLVASMFLIITNLGHVQQGQTRLDLQMVALCVLLTDGTGVIIFFCFAFENSLIYQVRRAALRIRKRIRKIAYQTDDDVVIPRGPVPITLCNATHAQIMRSFIKQGYVYPRTYRLRKYPACFVGSELVSFIIAHHELNGIVENMSREAALLVAHAMCDSQMFYHATLEHRAADDFLFYKVNVVFDDEDDVPPGTPVAPTSAPTLPHVSAVE